MWRRFWVGFSLVWHTSYASIKFPISSSNVVKQVYFTTNYYTQGAQVGSQPGQSTVFQLSWGTPLSEVSTLGELATLVNKSAYYSSFYRRTLLDVNTSSQSWPIHEDILYLPSNSSSFKYIVNPLASNNVLSLGWLYRRTPSLTLDFVNNQILSSGFRPALASNLGLDVSATAPWHPLCDLGGWKSPLACTFPMKWNGAVVQAQLEPGLPHIIVPAALVNGGLARHQHDCYSLDLEHGSGSYTFCSDDVQLRDGLPRYILITTDEINRELTQSLGTAADTIVVGTNIATMRLLLHLDKLAGPRIIITTAWVSNLDLDTTRMVFMILVTLVGGLNWAWSVVYYMHYRDELKWHNTVNWHLIAALGSVGLGWAINAVTLYYYDAYESLGDRYARILNITDTHSAYYILVWVAFHLAAALSLLPLSFKYGPVYWRRLLVNLNLVGLLVAFSTLVLDNSALSPDLLFLSMFVIGYMYDTIDAGLAFQLQIKTRSDLLFGLSWLAISLLFWPTVIQIYVRAMLQYYPSYQTATDWIIGTFVLFVVVMSYFQFVYLKQPIVMQGWKKIN